MKAKIFDGKKLAEKVLEKLRKEIKNRRLKLKLTVILVGDNPVSKVYINQKKMACEKVGIRFELFKFPSKISSQKFKKEIKKIVKNPANSGVIIQLPLPKKFNAQEILNLIPPEKDIDVLSEKSLGKFYTGGSKIIPPVVCGISHFFKEYKIPIKGKNVVLVGAGRLVGQPLALWLLREKAMVSVINEFTKKPSFITKKADIIISGVGKPNLIKGNMVKNGVIVIDAGTSVKNGKLVGDVDFKSVSQKASYITPVSGGVGPVTVACLIENLVNFKKKK